VKASRNSLDDLHVIACGVVRCDQSVFRASSSTDTLDRTVEVDAIAIDVYLCCLPWNDTAKLRLLEVRCNPQVIGRDNIQNQLARRDPLPRLQTSAANDATYRSDDLGIAQVELGVM
jgi:hypothetical protein